MRCGVLRVFASETDSEGTGACSEKTDAAGLPENPVNVFTGMEAQTETEILAANASEKPRYI